MNAAVSSRDEVMRETVRDSNVRQTCQSNSRPQVAERAISPDARISDA